MDSKFIAPDLNDPDLVPKVLKNILEQFKKIDDYYFGRECFFCGGRFPIECLTVAPDDPQEWGICGDCFERYN